MTSKEPSYSSMLSAGHLWDTEVESCVYLRIIEGKGEVTLNSGYVVDSLAGGQVEDKAEI